MVVDGDAEGEDPGVEECPQGLHAHGMVGSGGYQQPDASGREAGLDHFVEEGKQDPILSGIGHGPCVVGNDHHGCGLRVGVQPAAHEAGQGRPFDGFPQRRQDVPCWILERLGATHGQYLGVLRNLHRDFEPPEVEEDLLCEIHYCLYAIALIRDRSPV
jgi:hypothetical protein